MAKIALSMIVKNEEALIQRCLNSVLPLVDGVFISDTGSTDLTFKKIEACLTGRDVEWAVRSHGWEGFAANRNYALRMIPKKYHYALMIDADDRLEIAPDFLGSAAMAWKDKMDKDIYDVPVRHGGVVHSRPQIFRNDPSKYYWKGVLHEYLEAPHTATRELVPGLTVNAGIEGVRSRDPHKYANDAMVLEKAIAGEADPYLKTRYTFYWAQSLRDSEQNEKAIGAYQKRIDLGGWMEEVYISYSEIIRLLTRMGKKEVGKVGDLARKASEAVPARVEAIHAAAYHCRQAGDNKAGMYLAAQGLGKPQPPGLFIEPWIYDYALLDEYAVNAYWAGHHDICLKACLDLLTRKLPESERTRVIANARAAAERIIAPKETNGVIW